MIKIYRKTETIKAEQFDYEKWVHMRHDAYPMVFGDTAKDGGMMATNPVIHSLEGDLYISDGDWIATGINGEHWPIADDVFKKTYAELPLIPEYVANWIKWCKRKNKTIAYALHAEKMSPSVLRYLSQYQHPERWIDVQDKFARAWLDGYQVEEYE